MIVREMRLRAGLTQRELARRVGVDRSTVTKWELGISAPKARDIPRLATELNCSTDELLRGESIDKSRRST